MMQFRNHPLMHHWGFPNWPPVWVATRGLTQRVQGEVGILKAVKKVDFIKNKFFLTIEYNHQTYTGCLAFTDQSFCHFRSEEHTSELQSHHDLVCRLLLEKKKKKQKQQKINKETNYT